MAIAITQDIFQKLILGYKKFHLDQHLSLKEAYERTMQMFFLEGDNPLISFLPAIESLPTFRQFTYRGKAYGHSTDSKGKSPRLSAKPLGRRPTHPLIEITSLVSRNERMPLESLTTKKSMSNFLKSMYRDSILSRRLDYWIDTVS